jgi:hypothetical protein
MKTGKASDSTGFTNGKGFTRKLSRKEIAQQKRNLKAMRGERF